MEFKICNACGKSKPVNLFYLLEKSKPWKRSKCISCHAKRDKLNRAIRKASMLFLFLLLSWMSFSQTIEQQRGLILDSINYYRESPGRINKSYGLNVSLKQYRPIHLFKMNKKLNRKAQRHANKMARTLMYYHSNSRNSESIDAVQPWEGGYTATVMRLIVDKGVPSLGHRKHLLLNKDNNIGIGVSVSKKGRKETFICIQTN